MRGEAMMPEQDVMERIKGSIESHKIVLFMKGVPEAPQCGFSAAACEVLRKYPYEFIGIDVLADPDIRASLPAYSNWPTFPQLFVGGELIGGCDIVVEMDGSGELKQVLDAAHSS